MSNSNSFKQQAAAWQNYMQQQQSGGLIQRLFAWLILGIALMVGLGVMVVVLLLSWLLIPVMIYRARKRMKATQSGTTYANDSDVIEGEIVNESEQQK